MLNYSDIGPSLRAIADPTRGMIIDRLCRGPASVSELAKPFKLTFAAIVQHIQVLENVGIVKSEKTGRVRTCRLESQGLAPLATWLDQRRSMVERQLDRLALILNEDDAKDPT